MPLKKEDIEKLSKIADAILLLPTVIWLLSATISMIKEGLYGYASLFPFSFRIHAVTLLTIATFYITTFLTIRPHNPLKNFLISSLLVFLANAFYESVYFIFMHNVIRSVMPPPPTRPSPPPARPPPLAFPLSIILPIIAGPGSMLGVYVGVLLLILFNLEFHFLTKDKRRILLFFLCFTGFIADMLMLN